MPDISRLSTSFWLAVVVGAWALRPIWDIDLGWHLTLGRWMWEHGWPTTDMLGITTAGEPWTTFQGGYQLLVYAIERYAGIDAVRIAHALAVGVGIALFDRAAQRAGASSVLRFALICLALLLYEDRIRVRPHVFHFAFVWWAFGELLGPRSRWAEPVAGLRQLIWASLHAPASLWGLGMLGANAVASPRDWRRWTALVAGTAATVVAPGAWDGLTGALSVHTQGRAQALLVPEHWPLWHYANAHLGSHAWLVLGAVALCLAAFLFTLIRGRWPASMQENELEKLAEGKGCARLPSSLTASTLTALAMGLFSVLLARFAWYALAPLLVALTRMQVQRWPRIRLRLIAAAAALAFSADAITYVLPRWSHASPWTTTWQPRQFPERAASFLADAGIGGQIFPDSEWGGYLLWRLHPNIRVLTDGRIAFGDDVAELVAAERRHNRGKTLTTAAAKWNVDLAVRRRGAFAADPPPGWVLLYGDEVAEVWARDDPHLHERLQRTAKLVQ